MRLMVVFTSVLAMACSTDTFVGPDGGPDASSDGGSGGGDSSVVDASIDVASCAPTWCTTNPPAATASCTDFDESTALPSDWTPDVTNGGSVALVSSPADQCLSLHSHLAQVTGTAGAARVNHVAAISTSSAHATLALDVYLPKTDAGGTVFYFAIRTNALSIGLVQRSDGTWWLQSSLGTSTLTSELAQQGPVRGAFTRMVLDVIYQPSAVTATLSYRRADNNNLDLLNANGSAISLGSSVSFLVGTAATTQTGNDLDAYYDDVVTALQ